MIVGEAVCIALIGGVIGLVLACALTAWWAKRAQRMMRAVARLSITPFTALMSLGVAVFIGVVSSFVPAWNAARTNILDSLRYSG